jgi:chromosomal replication initiator protein
MKLNDGTVDETELKKSWNRSLSVIRAEIGEATFKSWFRNVEFGELKEDQLVLYVPTRFMRDWIEAHYAQRLLVILRKESENIASLVIDVVNYKNEAQKTEKNVNPVHLESSKHITKNFSDSGDHNSMLGAPIDTSLSFKNFVVGPSNELAYAAARRITESEKVSFNPLFLYGGVGLGKTHLLHAIALEIKKNWPQRKVLYLSAEKFMYQFIRV